jgi:hypothetical protein
MESLSCPLCGEWLVPTKRRHGLVWVCRVCRAGAVTLPILRQGASRPFVNQLWQMALHNGRPSTLLCPACTRLFTECRGATAAVNSQLKVCVRCFWVWLRPGALLSPTAVQPLSPARGRGQALGQGMVQEEGSAVVDACEVLSDLAAGVLRQVL